MAMDAFLEHMRATVIGEPSGAGANSYGDAEAKKYPRTGVQLYVSTLWHQLDQYDPGARIYVDVPARFTFAGYAAGRDPAVDAILRGDEMRSIPLIALMDGGAAARRVFATRQEQFRKYDWWSTPRFKDLKSIGADLLEDHKRPADAVEMLELLTELYPDEWNSWESLGRARIAAGLKKEGLESYACALAIDPDTFEDGDLRKAIAESGMSIAVPSTCPVQP